MKRPHLTIACYRYGGRRGPICYMRNGVLRVQGVRRGFAVYWLGWL